MPLAPAQGPSEPGIVGLHRAATESDYHPVTSSTHLDLTVEHARTFIGPLGCGGGTAWSDVAGCSPAVVSGSRLSLVLDSGMIRPRAPRHVAGTGWALRLDRTPQHVEDELRALATASSHVRDRGPSRRPHEQPGAARTCKARVLGLMGVARIDVRGPARSFPKKRVSQDEKLRDTGNFQEFPVN